MNQRREILRVLQNNESLTQSQIAERMYGDTSHNVGIYSQLQKMVIDEILIKEEGRPAKYRLSGSNSRVASSAQSIVEINEKAKYNKIWIINNLIYNASKDTLYPLVPGENFYVLYQKFNHKPAKLPDGKMAVYSFHTTDDECLKVGQVSSGDKTRYNYSHYKYYERQQQSSTFAKSIIEDQDFNNNGEIDRNNVAAWIKEHCERYDVIIDAPMIDGLPDKRKQKIILNFVEGLLQTYFDPRYEGKSN